MRMILPPVTSRREIDRNLVRYFRDHRPADFRRALADFCRYYNVKRPPIEWFEYIDWGKTAGKTFEDGRIHLVHPEAWKRGRVYKSERMWVQMVYHEMGHYIFWTDAERKADAFASRMVRGLRRTRRLKARTVARASRAAAASTRSPRRPSRSRTRTTARSTVGTGRRVRRIRASAARER